MLFALLVASSVTFAQQGQQKTPEEKATMQSQWMQQNLSLTSDQNTQVYNILLNSVKQMEAARSSGGDVRPQMQEISASRDKALQVILSADQFTKYQQHEQQMMQQRKNRGGGAPGGSAPGGGQN